MDAPANPFPTPLFVRFIAHQQLTADATGQITTLKAQRRGKGLFHWQFSPHQPIKTQFGATEPWSEKLQSTSSQETRYRDRDCPTLPNQPAPHQSLTAATAAIDEPLFDDIFTTTITPQRWPQLYQASASPRAAIALELQAAAEVVATYRLIKFNQTSPLIQQLNDLLP